MRLTVPLLGPWLLGRRSEACSGGVKETWEAAELERGGDGAAGMDARELWGTSFVWQGPVEPGQGCCSTSECCGACAKRWACGRQVGFGKLRAYLQACGARSER